MKPLVIIAVFALGLAAVATPDARADSIWARRDSSSAFLYRDNVACDIGDSLTLAITESSSFQFSGSRDMDKESNHSATGSISRTGTGESEATSILSPYELTETSGRDFSGSSAYTGTRTFRDSITVTVMDRLPNGNLVICGRAARRIDGEDTVTIVTGIVRPIDVSATNMVSSQRVAQLSVYYETNGPSRAFLDQGWLSSALNFIWPF